MYEYCTVPKKIQVWFITCSSTSTTVVYPYSVQTVHIQYSYLIYTKSDNLIFNLIQKHQWRRRGGNGGTSPPPRNPENFQRVGIKHWIIQQN